MTQIPENAVNRTQLTDVDAKLQEKRQKHLKNLEAKLLQVKLWIKNKSEKIVDQRALEIVLGELEKLYSELLSDQTEDSVTVIPLEGQPARLDKQNLKKDAMWGVSVDSSTELPFGLGRSDEAFYTLLHVLVKRGKFNWDQFLSVANTIALELSTDLSRTENTTPPEALRSVDTAGFVILPYYIPADGVPRMWVMAEKTVTGAGLSVYGASVGNLSQLKITGVSQMFGGELKKFIAFKQGAYNAMAELANVEDFLQKHDMFGPLATEDANRGDQSAMYIPVELTEIQAQAWKKSTSKGNFVPVSDLEKLRASGLLLGHTKNSLDVLHEVEMQETINMVRFIKAALDTDFDW